MKKLTLVAMLTFTSIGLVVCGSEETTNSPAMIDETVVAAEARMDEAMMMIEILLEQVEIPSEEFMQIVEEEAQNAEEQAREAVNDRLNSLLN